MQKDQGPKARAIDELHLRKVEGDVFIGLGEAFDVRPYTGDIDGIQIVFNGGLLGHDRLKGSQDHSRMVRDVSFCNLKVYTCGTPRRKS